MADQGEAIERDLAEAISAVFAKHETSMVLKSVSVIETMDATGERYLWTLTSPNPKAWDIAGLLVHASNLQQARTVSNTVNRAGDDDHD